MKPADTLQEILTVCTTPTEILSENGDIKVQNCIGEVADITHLTLNTYEGFTKKTLTFKNGETKEVYMEDTTLKVDSSEWQETKIDGHKVKINSKGDIIEYLDGAEQGEQLFTWEAAMREANNQGKRPPTYEELISPEYKEAIVKTTSIFSGFRDSDGTSIWNRGSYAYFLSSGVGSYSMYGMSLSKGTLEVCNGCNYQLVSYSVRCLKDSSIIFDRK